MAEHSQRTNHDEQATLVRQAREFRALLEREGVTVDVAPDAPLPVQFSWLQHAVIELLTNFRTHQNELQLQNEELRAAQEELAEARDSYRDLYDFAPVGYFTLDSEGRMSQMNITGVNLLGYSERQPLLQKQFSKFIARESQDAFHYYWLRLQQSKGVETIELLLRKADGSSFWARVGAVIAPPSVADAVRVYHFTVSDVTNEVNARKEAEDGKRILDALLEYIPEGITIVSAPDVITEKTSAYVHRLLSDGWDETSGLSMEDWLVKIDHFLADGVTPARPEDLPLWRAVKLGETIEGQKFVLRRPNGDLLPILCNAGPIKDKHGTITGAIVAWRDISELKKAQWLLEQQNAVLEAVFAAIQDAILIYDTEMRVQRVNPGFMTTYGFDPTGLYVRELMERTECRWLDGRPFRFDEQPTPRALGGETVVAQRYLITRSDGADVALETSAAPLRVGDAVQGVVTVWHDFSDRKRMDDALRLSEARYRTLFDTMLEGFCIIEVLFGDDNAPIDYRFLEINPAFEAQTGLHNAQGKLMRELAPEHETHWFEIYGHIALTGEPACFINEARALNRWFNVSAYRIGGDNSRQVAILFNDITKRVHAEKELQASLCEKEVLLKEIHHRVKNNMQIISSLVSLQSASIDDPALRDLFNDLRDQVRTLALVHEKLYQSANLASVDFATYISSLLSYLTRAHAPVASAIHVQLDLDPVTLSVDVAVPCGLILNELITNAFKHAFHDRDDAEISIGLHIDEENRVCLSVRDNGVGLPNELDWRHAQTLGLRLVGLLTAQISGSLDLCSNGGAAFTLTFAKG